MKKNGLFIAAAVVLAAAASCNKAETLQPEIPQAVKINVSVGDLAPGTKALKSGWENGDVINVYLDDITAYAPDFTLTYNGSVWTASALSAEATARLKASGKLKGFWEGTNSALSTWNQWKSGTSYYYFDFPNRSNAATTGVRTPVVAYFYNIAYTYSGGTLSATIGDWYFTTNFQLVVTDLPVGTYALYTGVNMLDACTSICVDASKVDVSMYGNTSSSYRLGGIANADGVAFIGHVSRPNVTLDYVFYLVDCDTGKTYRFTKNLSIATTSGKELFGAKVSFDSFALVVSSSSGVPTPDFGDGGSIY